MVYLLLAVLCSVSIGMIFKVAGRHRLDRTALLTVNYAAAVAVAAVLIAAGGRGAEAGLTMSGPLILLGIGTGALLIFGFFMLSVATDVAGMGLSIGVMRVSVVIPFLASWLVWSEEPSGSQLAGMALAAVSFFLIAQKPDEDVQEPRGETPPAAASPATTSTAASRGGGASRTSSGAEVAVQTPREDRTPTGRAPSNLSPDNVVAEDDDLDLPEPDARVLGTLFILFLSGGAVDITMKTFQETFGADNSRFLFLLLAFGIAFLIGLVIVLRNGLRTGTWPDRRTWAWGAVLGVINYGSLEFLLRALEQLAGTVVFPVNNISIVVLAALLGVAFWGERLSRTNLAGLALAVLGLVLLSDLSLF